MARPTLHRQSGVIDLTQHSRPISLDEIERRLRGPARHICLGVNPGDDVVLIDTPGCIIPAGRYRVSHVNPDGTFHVGGNTAVMPERIAEIVRSDVSKREGIYLVAGAVAAFVVGVLLWVLS